MEKHKSLLALVFATWFKLVFLRFIDAVVQMTDVEFLARGAWIPQSICRYLSSLWLGVITDMLM